MGVINRIKIFRIRRLLRKTDKKMSRHIDDLITFALGIIDTNKPNLQFPKEKLDLYYLRDEKRKEMQRICSGQ